MKISSFLGVDIGVVRGRGWLLNSVGRFFPPSMPDRRARCSLTELPLAQPRIFFQMNYIVSNSQMAASPTPKLVVVVGATGNQGGSVARRFLRAGPDRFHVRGLTRDTNSLASQALITLGADMVQADLYDCDSLKAAFRGASVIFSVTNYWEPFAPHNLESSKLEAVKLGFGTVRSYAGYMEATAGRNIADAAASTVDTLDGNGLIVSTLSHARRCSGGKFQELYHFDAKADVFPFYVRERHPNLAAKMRCVHTGYFMTSHRILPQLWLAKVFYPSYDSRRHPLGRHC